MNPVPRCSSPWPIFPLLALSLSLALSTRASATGFSGPDDYLTQGGTRTVAAPEFYWALEVKRLARAFRPTEAPATSPEVFPPRPGDDEYGSLDANMVRPRELTTDKDAVDFADALKQDRIKPPDAAAAQKQHEEARSEISSPDADLPAEFPSEFADYHRGAHAFARGREHWAEARQAWEKLLQRPAAERHYRTVWAAFMLGKLALKEGSAEAPKWFQQTRALAKEGFADSLSLAADSYGWEGRSEYKQQHPEKAAPLFLTQLALGDESAVESLKALIPDRDQGSPGVYYAPEGSDDWTEEQWNAYRAKLPDLLRKLARNPLLRRLITVHILATETAIANYGDLTADEKSASRLTRWLGVIKSLGLKETEDAEYLGWAAYQQGDYQGAAAWLEKARGHSPAAAWLHSKLLRRGGKLTEAAQEMVVAWKGVQERGAYTGWQPAPAEPKPATEKAGAEAATEEEADLESYGEGFSFIQHAGAHLATLQLARNEFLAAFEAFLKVQLWDDAAFVAESILTADELKAYVDRVYPAFPPPRLEHAGELPPSVRYRYLLGRRLVREDRYAEAAAYLLPPYEKILARYTAALETANNAKLPQADRARAFFTAAYTARHDGMEIMGTEVAPDGFALGGDFEFDDVAGQRRTGKWKRYLASDEVPKNPYRPTVAPATPQEVTRLKKNQIKPDVRFHYRIIAASLALKAAALLPDGSAELADVLNTAGNWSKDRDDKLADRCYVELLRRAGKTELGQAAKTKRWFVEESGPWSEREGEAWEALHKELKLE